MTARAFFYGLSWSRGLEQIEQPGHVAGEEGYQEEALATGNKVLGEGKNPKETDAYQHRHEIDNGDAHDAQGMDDGGKTQHQEDVHDVGADDVADGDGRTTLIGCDDTRGELGQRGAASHDGEADDALAHGIAMGNVLGGVDEEIATEDEAGQTEDDEREVAPETFIVALLAHALYAQFFLVFGQKTVSAGHLEGIEEKGQEAYEQDDAVGAADLVAPEVGRVHIVETEHEEQHGGAHGEGDILLDGGGLDGHRGDGSRTAHDEQGVEDIGADDIADGHIGRALDGRHEADEHLGGGGSGGHDGQTDDDFGHTHAAGQRRGTFGKAVGSPQYEGDTHDDIDNIEH